MQRIWLLLVASATEVSQDLLVITVGGSILLLILNYWIHPEKLIVCESEAWISCFCLQII